MSATSSDSGGENSKKALAARNASIEKKLSLPRWCDPFLKGQCQKGDACPLPHMPAAAVEEIKRSNRLKKQVSKQSAPALRQRSQTPHKGNKSKKAKGRKPKTKDA